MRFLAFGGISVTNRFQVIVGYVRLPMDKNIMILCFAKLEKSKLLKIKYLTGRTLKEGVFSTYTNILTANKYNSGVVDLCSIQIF